MRDLGDVIGDLTDERADDDRLYATLAPVYDFVYERHFDYDEQLAVVTEAVPADAERVLEVGCGTGRLLARLEREYESVVGVERSESMCGRARARTEDTRVIIGDATRHRVGATFDAVVSLGRVTGHVTDDGAASALLENCFAHLKPGGVLLFDYFPTERMEDNYETAETFESERYRVEREARSTIPELGRMEAAFDYEMIDLTTGERATASETMTLRTFSADEVRELLADAGFAEVTIRPEAADGWPLAVASAPEGND